MATERPLRHLSLDTLRERTSSKWRRYDPDVLPLWVAEMDVMLAEPIREALEHAVRIGDTGYPVGTAYPEAFVDFARSRWDWSGLVTDNVRPVSAVIQGYTEALLLAAGQGGTVVVTSPVYPPFYSYVREAGLTVIEAPLNADMRLDLAAIDSALGGARRDGAPGVALLLCNPHNPGGTLHTREELSTLATVVRSHGATVVSDEIHAPLVYAPGTFTPYLTVDQTAMALHAASKAWNLAAIPAALLVFGEDAADARRVFVNGAHHGPTHFGAIAQTAAYREGGPWLDAVLVDLAENRDLLADLLAEHVPGARLTPLESTYLAWVDCRALGLDAEPAAVFLERGRVAFNPGPTFGTGGEGHVRINIATHPEILTEAVRRMAAALR